jgi:hypothetical protein
MTTGRAAWCRPGRHHAPVPPPGPQLQLAAEPGQEAEVLQFRSWRLARHFVVPSVGLHSLSGLGDSSRRGLTSTTKGPCSVVLTGAATATRHSVAVVFSPDALPASHWSHPRLKSA